jgi:atypical dual specificity phosphatase
LGRTGRAYRKVRSRFTDKPTSFGWVIEGQLAASGLPSSKGQLKWLGSHGVDSVLTLTESPLPKEWLDEAKLQSKHVQMFDHAPPTQASLEESTRYIASQIKEGRTVVVHCLAGLGRTGSVLAAYLIEHDGKTADEAIVLLRSTRPGSIERSQEQAVREYYLKVRQAKR